MKHKKTNYFYECSNYRKQSPEDQKKEILYAFKVLCFVLIPPLIVSITGKFFVLYIIYMFLLFLWFLLLKSIISWNLLLDKENKYKFILEFEEYIISKTKKYNVNIKWKINNKEYNIRPIIEKGYVSFVQMKDNGNFELLKVKSFVGIKYISFPNGQNINAIIEDICDCIKYKND